MERRTQEKQAVQGSISAHSACNWNFLWKHQVPSKIKRFCWHVLTDSLPTRPNLVRRHISEIDVFPDCMENVESVIHVFRDCHYARQFCALANVPTASLYFENMFGNCLLV